MTARGDAAHSAGIGMPANAPRDVRPEDADLDLFGITHPGFQRAENQDHFLLAKVNPEIHVDATSLPDLSALPLRGRRLGTVMLVADGVGGATDGGSAARLATESITRYVVDSLRCYHAVGAGKDDEFFTALRDAALDAHDAVRAEAVARGDDSSLATTLTLGIAVWPLLYVVQVGDSRAYIYTHGELRQITHDQTLAQGLVDEGLLEPERAGRSPLAHVLSSALGGSAATPVVSRADITERGCILIFCTDGLTKHVSHEEIASECARIESAEHMGRKLLQMALDRGGSDNITIIVARAPLKASACA
ncbi:MAG: protein phosphatase 2C domain-containing protein [Gemmatimonadaceae bacterium]